MQPFVKALLPLLVAGLLPLRARAEIFVDAGIGVTRVESKLANQDARSVTTDSGAHFAVGARKQVSSHSDLAVRLELDDVGSTWLLAVRALDYRFNFSERLAATAFLGAARLDLATPAYGYYVGGGVQLKNLLPRWDLNVDLRYGDRVARDNLLPTDPQGGSPDNFHDVYGITLYFTHRF
jgi:hypothetical protein